MTRSSATTDPLMDLAGWPPRPSSQAPCEAGDFAKLCPRSDQSRIEERPTSEDRFYPDILPAFIPTMMAVAHNHEGEESSELIGRARRGDPEAFGGLVRTHQTRLFRQAISLCGNAAQAEDLVQETFLTAWRRLDRFNGACRLFTWLCGILLNLHRNAARQRRPLGFSSLGTMDHKTASHHLSVVTDSDGSPAESLESMERNAVIQRCLDRLPEKHRQVVYLRFFADDSIDGIAAALDCSPGTVKSRLFHALDKLMQMPEMLQLTPPKDAP